MISYTLICECEHAFAEWFEGYDDLQAQLKAKTLACPACGSNKLAKGLSAPSVGGSSKPEPAACPATGCGGGACPFKG